MKNLSAANNGVNFRGLAIARQDQIDRKNKAISNYIHKRCKVPDGLTYKGELLWSSFTRYCFVCEKRLTSGNIYRRKS